VIVGSSSSVSAPAQPAIDGSDLVFSYWSDGGAASHDLDPTATPTTYTAHYRTPGTPAPSPTGLGLRASPAVIAPGQEVSLDGRLAAQDGAGLAGQQVELHARPAGAAAWTLLGTAGTGTDGTVRFAQRPARATSYQLRYAGGDGRLPSASELATVTVASATAARIATPSIPLGTTARISGTVAPPSPGESAALDQWSPGTGWRQLRTAPLDQAGGFEFTVKPSATGATSFRVRKLAGSASDGSASATLPLKVYRTVIAGVRVAGPGLNGEYLDLRNTGTTDVNLATWAVHHGRLGWTVRLRPYTLRAGQSVHVYSGLGASRSGRLFLNRRISVWRSSRTGDPIQVVDGGGLVAAAIRYRRG
jgi:hypothetical protein